MFAPRNDWDTQRAQFAIDDRLRLANALPADDVENLHQKLNSIPYAAMLTKEGVGRVLTPTELQAMSSDDQAALQQQIFADASRGVGFLYEGHQLKESSDPELKAILDRINTPETIERIRYLTGITDITHADGQATRYLPGHFLTRHLDDPSGQQRRIAYVLSVTRRWHPDWGGLTQFFERDGTPRDAWCPQFNTFSMFNVRHVHSVTYVTPFAAEPRYSITGWFRAGDPV